MIAPAPGFHIQMLNCFELSSDGQVIAINAGSQRLIVFLALYKRALPRSYVAAILWPDVATDRASANLRASIWRVPEQCRGLVDLKAQHIRLTPGVTIDYLDAKALAHRLVDRTESSDADLSRRARSDLSSELLPACYDEWVLIERERFRQLRVHALEAQCERLTARGRYGEAIDAGLAAVCAEPLRESSHRVLIKAHLAEGNNAEANRQYRLYCQVLRDELGAEPSEGLRDLATSSSAASRLHSDRPGRGAKHTQPAGRIAGRTIRPAGIAR